MLGACQNDRPGRQKGARVGQPPGRIDQLSGRAVRARAISTWRVWEALRRNLGAIITEVLQIGHGHGRQFLDTLTGTRAVDNIGDNWRNSLL
jgi:hypothetical protein